MCYRYPKHLKHAPPPTPTFSLSPHPPQGPFTVSPASLLSYVPPGGRTCMSSLAITLDDEVIDKPLQPVSNYILVKMFPAISRTAGGIVLPDEVRS